MSRVSSLLLCSLPALLACGSSMEPLESSSPVVGGNDASVDVPVGPIGGSDGGVSQLPPSTGNNNTGSDGGQPTTCEIQTVQTSPSIPDMMIVLDRSGSMNRSQSSPTDRWGGSRVAISQVVQQHDEDIRFGLLTFPEYNPGGVGNACTTGTVNVPVGPGVGDQIALTLQAMNAAGNTPTAPSLEVARTTLGPVMSDLDVRTVPKYVLLVTDGDPNCTNMMTGGGSGGGVDQVARDAAIASIHALADDGIKTYVVGFETAGTSFEEQLDLMATAGDTGATQHTSVASGDELVAALADVIAMVRGCDFELNQPVANASYVAVEVDDVTRALGRTADGWTLGSDNQTVTLTGDACMAVKNGATLNIEVRCEIVNVN